MALNMPIISRIVDSGVTTVAVYFVTPGGNDGHIVIGRQLLHTQTMEDLLWAQGKRVDGKAEALRIANERQAQS